MPKTVKLELSAGRTLRRMLMQTAVPIWVALATVIPQSASAQSQENPAPAMLVADTVYITPGRELIAQGSVEAFYGGARLQAERVTFDRTNGSLTIEGPITLTKEGGAAVIYADAAELDADLRNGILRGARMVFDQQVQLAALQMTRSEGRYTELYKTSVTSCDVCDDGRAPLWQIRAERITHDGEERQLYFEHAHLRIMDVPVLYFPTLRLPDPTLERASGFLIPSVTTSTQLGFGIKLPYFLAFGDHRDLTITPYISSKSRTVNLRYRQAFRNGDIELEGAFSRDKIQPSDDRGYLFAKGDFRLPRDYRLRFDLKTVSDEGYLGDYDISDADRLRSRAVVSRVKRDQLFSSDVSYYQTLRDGEDQDFIPATIVTGTLEHRLFPRWSGGELRLRLDGMQFVRDSGLDADEDNINGRDMTRLSADMDWRRSWIIPGAIEATWMLGLGVDSFAIADDTFYENDVTRVTPKTALSLRRPMRRTTASGATQLFEPIVQLGWTDVSGDDVPNEASNISEFDLGNLLDLSRFPDTDAREDGTSFVYGAQFTHIAPSGWQASGTVAQVIRDQSNSKFTSTSGLDGEYSNVLIAGQYKVDDRIALTAISLFDQEWSVSKAEFRGDWSRDQLSMSGSYLWLQADPAEERDKKTSELWLSGSYQINDTWTAGANMRYDLIDARATRAGLGVSYSNECVTLDLSVGRRYSSTTSIEPTTDFGFTLSLNGFSVKSGNKTHRRTCSTT